MERKIGERFDFKGEMLEVIEQHVVQSVVLLIKAHEELVRCGIESEIVQEIEEYLKTTTSGKTI